MGSDRIRSLGSRTNPFATSSTATDTQIISEPVDTDTTFIFFPSTPNPSRGEGRRQHFSFNRGMTPAAHPAGRSRTFPRGGTLVVRFVPVWTKLPQTWIVGEVKSRPSLSAFGPSLVPLYTGNRTSFHGVECSGIPAQ